MASVFNCMSITNYGEGGRDKTGGGCVKNVLVMLKGRHNKFWGSFYSVAWSFSRIEGGRKKFPLFKRGGGAQKV